MTATDGSGLDKYDVAVFAASCDSPELNKAFAEAMRLDYPVLSDPDHKVMETYGAWGVKKVSDGKETKGVIRSTVLIDPKGNIAQHWPHVTPKGHAGQVRQAIEKLTNPQ